MLHTDGNVLTDEGSLSAAPDFPSVAKAWWGVAVLTLLYALSLVDRQIIALLINDIRADLAISDFQVGLVSGLAFGLFYATFGIFVGRMADHYPRRRIIFAGMLIWSICAASCGLARNVTQLTIARFGLGAGEASLNPSAYSLISDSFPRERLSLALSVFGMGGQIGAALSVLLGGLIISVLPRDGVIVPLVGHLAPWRIAFLVVGLPCLLIAWIVWTIGDPPRRDRSAADDAGLADTIRFFRARLRLFGGHFLGFGLLMSAAYSWTIWVPIYLMRHFGMPIGEVVTIFACMTLIAGVGGTVAAGFLADRLFARRTDIHLLLPAGFALVQMVAVAGAIGAGSVPLFVVGGFIFILMSAYSGLSVAALQLVTPNEYRGQVSALYLFFYNLIGIGVGPTMVGAFTTFVFADDRMVGWSILATCTILLPMGIVVLLSTRASMRRAVAAADAWADRSLLAPVTGKHRSAKK